MSNGWIKIKIDILSVLIWVQTVCKGYQRTTKSKERVNISFLFSFVTLFITFIHFLIFHSITNFSSHFIKGDHPVDCLQNTNLTSRVASLESCDCNPECSLNGQYFDEGETWSLDQCTICICKVRRLKEQINWPKVLIFY